MATKTQGEAGYYVWEVPGKSVIVHLHLDVVDRLLNEVMRGFGAVPKRGAEVGGVLIGTIERTNPAIVRVEDFEPVECEHKRGPSFLLSDTDLRLFDEVCRRWRAEMSPEQYGVGFYRSHTREGTVGLSMEDIATLDEYFPSPECIALLVKPYGTKVSVGGFFFREGGKIQDASPLEFPFRRRELTGEDTPPRPPGNHKPLPEPVFNGMLQEEPERGYYYAPLPTHPRGRSTLWIPLSLIFLLFGLALGMMIGLTRGGVSHPDPREFGLGLSVLPADDNLNVKWDRQAAAIRTAHHGTLEIEGFPKPVELDATNLQSGTITVQRSARNIHFRLTVSTSDHTSVSETFDWKQ